VPHGVIDQETALGIDPLDQLTDIKPTPHVEGGSLHGAEP
jgi:hypothetical protein